jgi:epoxyqueuosine reductase
MKKALEEFARAEGFSGFGVTRPDAVPELAARLHAFVTKERHGDMHWMTERVEWRGNPAALWPEAKSVVMVAEAYSPSFDPLAILDMADKGAVSAYAQGRDYHDIVKKRLKRVGRWLIDQAGGEIKVFVDTAPVMEKPLAAAAGLGWQGKHTNLVSRELGNWFFLGAIFTTLELETDTPGRDNCGNCRACLDICPTNAFPAPYQLDARRCISYLTIEHKGPVDPELRPLLGNRIYGCDDCLAICPWNKFAADAADLRYHGDGSNIAPDLASLAKLDDESFRKRFSGSPIKRIGVSRFLRNVAYAIGNSGQRGLLASVQALVDAPDPVLTDAARWAVDRLKGSD